MRGGESPEKWESVQMSVGSISTHRILCRFILQALQQDLPFKNRTIQPHQELQLYPRLKPLSSGRTKTNDKVQVGKRQVHFAGCRLKSRTNPNIKANRKQSKLT